MKIDRNAVQSNGDFPLLQPGEYRFEVVDAVKAVSASGNDMYQLRLKVFQDNGPAVTVFDNLIEKENCLFRFVQFFDSLGMDTDDTDATKNAIGEVGRARIKIEQGTNGYADRNRVDRYLPAPKTEKPPVSVLPTSSDDLPF